MCGIVGVVARNAPLTMAKMEATIKDMTDRIVHRGPDACGWWGEDGTIGLGHRRLSIIDLSEHGRQPMLSPSGRYVIVFNGEIYNYKEIQTWLQSSAPELYSQLRGHSDTETMLAAIEQLGVYRAVHRFIGMFGFALYDRKDRKLHLVRDRMGEKPLYYAIGQQNEFLFGSELKALQAHPQFVKHVDRDAIGLYLQHCYIPAPYTIFQSCYKLLPGTILTYDTQSGAHEIQSYWTVEQAVQKGQGNTRGMSEQEAVKQLDALLRQSIRGQMVSDVPIGAFLSGGLDSSTIVSIMQAQSSQKVKTFTIGFHEEGYNEAVHAKEVARHLGTDHTELYVTPQEALDVIPKLPQLYDEPFSDSSQIPTYLVSELARKHVTVSLSGDGGDELFGGYKRYFITQDIWSKLNKVPAFGRVGASKLIHSIPVSTWNQLSRWWSPLRKRATTPGTAGDKMYRLAELMKDSNLNSRQFYRYMISHWKDHSIVIGSGALNTVFETVPNHVFSDFSNEMMYLDMISYLPDDILVKVDRAGMAVSLESRIPFLDHRIVEFAWQLPVNYKIKGGQGKWLLRQVLNQYVPETIMNRPKMGFSVPIGSWLRGPLREWAEHLLSESRLKQQGYLNPAPIRQRWKEHLEGKRNRQYDLWDVLMFQAWLEEQTK
ncbi:asparagine synthase (glutamine-hydrolyzing) [Paenibacillus profundus]|uniref:asparagine synthase (glutamine-hydrolyzing) n=1 Tax=Paenibacillus profundus TaxID=1173085 RepID=A0ABS8YAG7_9BACL|nr:asparagine synthase (glutamine-hydrolyzing) [Paenibacillus profundus]MCE5168920.1 asparagine synthase (glutamine-hydrolyzing) [Paenibacillus profundus]